MSFLSFFTSSQSSTSSARSSWASRDIDAYQNRYPNQRDDRTLSDNYRFHCSEIPSKPDGDTINNIHRHWAGDYRRLERHHGYIQWLFPIREPGMNYQQHPLQLHEIASITSDRHCQRRFIRSYRLMLDFYGFELVDVVTGELKRSASYDDRMSNLIHSSHNWLRVTRILKSLGELGYEHLKLGLCLMLWAEARTSNGATMRQSAKNYWCGTLRDTNDRELMCAVIERTESMTNLDQYRELLQRRHRERQADSPIERQPLTDKADEDEVDKKKVGDEDDVDDSSPPTAAVEESKADVDGPTTPSNKRARTETTAESEVIDQSQSDGMNIADSQLLLPEDSASMIIADSQPEREDDASEPESEPSNHRSEL